MDVFVRHYYDAEYKAGAAGQARPELVDREVLNALGHEINAFSDLTEYIALKNELLEATAPLPINIDSQGGIRIRKTVCMGCGIVCLCPLALEPEEPEEDVVYEISGDPVLKLKDQFTVHDYDRAYDTRNKYNRFVHIANICQMDINEFGPKIPYNLFQSVDTYINRVINGACPFWSKTLTGE